MPPVTDPAILSQLNGGAPAAMPAQPRAPGVIQGAPVQAAPPPQITPYQQEQLARGVRTDERAARGEERAIAATERGTVDQNRAAGFMRRAINANENFGQVDIAPRGTIGQFAQEQAPNLMNEVWNSGDRQLADQAEREFVMAVLRYDSGAAIPDPELNSSADNYFPRPGNTPEVIAQKAEARRVAIEGLLQSSGVAGERAAREMGWGAPDSPISTDNGVPSVRVNVPREAPATANGTPPRPTGGEGGPGGGARAPSQQDVYANGVEFGMDTMGQQEASFDRNAYLQNELGLGSGEESLLTGFARANSGNRAITAEDVRRFYQANNLPQPTDADLATFVEDMRTSAPGTTWGGIDTTAPEEAYQATLDAAIEQRGENPESQGFAANRGVGQGLQFNLGDEIAGGLNAIGSNNPGMAYLTERDMQRRMDERASEASPWTYGGGQVLGGLITGSSYARGPMTVSNAARVGAVEGAVAGFGSGEGLGNSLANSAVGAGGGAALGGAITYSGQRIGNALASRSTNRQSNALVQEAADRRGIVTLPADMGGTGTRMATAVSRRTLGEIPIAAAAQRSVDSGAAARNTAAREIGSVTDKTGAGQAAQRGARGWMDQTASKVEKLYQEVPIDAAQELVLDNTRSTLGDLVQGFRSNRALSKIWTGNARLRQTLEALTPTDNSGAGRVQFAQASERLLAAQDDLGRVMGSVSSPQQQTAARNAVVEARRALDETQIAATRPPEGGQLSWGDASRLRSIVGEIIGKPGIASDGAADAALRKFYGALTRDMEATATAEGPRALSMWRRATQYKRGRENRIEQVLTSILGPKGNKGEAQAFEQINRWAQQDGGNFKAIAQTLRSMDAEEANTVRATLLSRMGNAKKGAQNADGDEFSPAVFVTEWNGLDPRARAILFPTAEHRKAVEDITSVFANMKAAGSYTNTSMTSLGTNATALAAMAWASPPMAALSAVGSLAVGKLLSSARFARWLAGVPKNPRAQQAYMSRLDAIGGAEPVIAPEIAQFLRAVNDNNATAGNVAAEPQQDEGR